MSHLLTLLLKYTYKYQSDTVMQGGLFGDTEEMKPVRPEVPPLQESDEIELLKRKKNLWVCISPLIRWINSNLNLTMRRRTLSEVRNIEDNLSRDPKLRNIEFTVGALLPTYRSSIPVPEIALGVHSP